MNIDIDIALQEEGKFRRLYVILGSLTILYLGFSYLVLEVNLFQIYFFWFVLLSLILDTIFYAFGIKTHSSESSPYLRINEEKIEKRKGGVFTKPEIIYWSNVKDIDIKLFEILLNTTDDKLISLDLASLNENNLKIVKEYVEAIRDKTLN